MIEKKVFITEVELSRRSIAVQKGCIQDTSKAKKHNFWEGVHANSNAHARAVGTVGQSEEALIVGRALIKGSYASDVQGTIVALQNDLVPKLRTRRVGSE